MKLNPNTNYLMQRLNRILTIILQVMFSLPFQLFAQCPDAGFSSTGAVCAGQPINFTNLTTAGTAYEWDFCGGDFSTPLVVTRDTSTISSVPIAITPVFDGTNWFGFIVSDDGGIERLEYGSTLLNTPVSTNMGVIGCGGPLRSNISIFQYNANWYGFLACQSSQTLISYNFGSSLSNTPIVSASAVFNELGGAYFQDLVVDNGHYYLFVTRFSNSIAIFDFGMDPTSTPAASTLALASGTVSDISIEKICNNWYGFLTDYGAGNILRIDFGTSLMNPSPVMNTVATGLSVPVDLVTAFDGKDWNVFAESNGGAGIYQLNFGADLLNTAPVLSTLSLPGFTATSLSLSIAKEQSAFYLFSISYGGHAYGTIKFESPCSVNPPISNLTTPAPVYAAGGTYWVGLFAQDGSGNTDYFSDSLVINYAPNTGFDISGFCFGDITQFTDTSTLSVGTISQWHWDFGDADTSNLQNDTHTYLLSSSYTVSLTAYADNGCASTATQIINITPRPTASFILPNGCSDVQLQFTDNSNITSGSISNWLWTFGNGDSSVVQSPLYGFPDGGGFNVSLQVTSAAGCSDDTTFFLSISPSPDAAFATDNTCVGQSVSFTDQTVSQVNITNYSWSFGDGGTSPLSSPNYIYSSPDSATYSVTFIVQSANNCSDTVVIPVHVSNPPTAGFSYLPLNACEGNSVSFSDLSIANGDTISALSWDFDDGSIDSVLNPTHIFGTYDTFHVSLIAYSPSHCPSAPFS
ncbi:MAG: PKD domain-containing protein, partial [Bacteroidota bacterium]